jgi:hypothetical protein
VIGSKIEVGEVVLSAEPTRGRLFDAGVVMVVKVRATTNEWCYPKSERVM